MLIQIILAGLFGGCWGYSMTQFAIEGDWAMLTLTIGLIIAVFYLVIWIIYTRYK